MDRVVGAGFRGYGLAHLILPDHLAYPVNLR